MDITKRSIDFMINNQQSMVQAHYTEVPFADAELPLDIHWEAYQELQDRDLLLIYTAEDAGMTVGYIVVIASPMLHHKGHMLAYTDSFFVHPAFRGKGVIKLLVDAVVQACKAGGVYSLHLITNANFPDAERVAKEMGMMEIEKTFALKIGG